MGSNPIINKPLLLNQMETAETKTQSLLEIWNSDKGEEKCWGTFYPERSKLERKLNNLLEYEVEEKLYYYQGGKEKAEEVLAEYRSNFEWDTQFELSIDWEVEPQTANQSIELSMDELLDYLNGDTEPSEPDFSEVEGSLEGGYSLTGDFTQNVRAYITNFRPKEPKHKYLLSVLVESEVEGSAVVEQLKTVFPTWEVLSITPND